MTIEDKLKEIEARTEDGFCFAADQKRLISALRHVMETYEQVTQEFLVRPLTWSDCQRARRAKLLAILSGHD